MFFINVICFLGVLTDVPLFRASTIGKADGLSEREGVTGKTNKTLQPPSPPPSNNPPTHPLEYVY